MSQYIAIDIALVPLSPILEELITLSRTIEKGIDVPKLALASDIKVPHVTMGMAFVRESDAQKLVKQFDGIQMNLKVSGKHELDRGKFKTQYLDIESMPQLLNMHLSVMEELAKHNAEVEGRFAEPVEENTLNYVRNFKDHAHDHYSPHITMGYGNSTWKLNLETIACELRVYQLGNHCTCHTRLS